MHQQYRKTAINRLFYPRHRLPARLSGLYPDGHVVLVWSMSYGSYARLYLSMMVARVFNTIKGYIANANDFHFIKKENLRACYVLTSLVYIAKKRSGKRQTDSIAAVEIEHLNTKNHFHNFVIFLHYTLPMLRQISLEGQTRVDVCCMVKACYFFPRVGSLIFSWSHERMSSQLWFTSKHDSLRRKYIV